MSRSWRTEPAATLTRVVLMLGAGFVHGCALTGPDGDADATELSFSTSITVAPSHVGTIDPRYDLELRAYYERAGGTRVPIANVDAAGVVTGLAADRANIMAHWGEGQSSNGVQVTVTTPPTP